MSSLIINMRAEALVAMLTGARDRLHAALMVAVQRLGLEMQGRVKNDKLTGQVLHARTGTLRRSINLKVADTGSGVIATVGTNLKYAAIHEYGFDGIEHVRAHTRRSARQMAVKRSKRAKVSEGAVFVRAHDRHMVMPERSFLRSTLTEMGPKIQTDLRAAITGAIRP